MSQRIAPFLFALTLCLSLFLCPALELYQSGSWRRCATAHKIKAGHTAALIAGGWAGAVSHRNNKFLRSNRRIAYERAGDNIIDIEGGHLGCVNGQILSENVEKSVLLMNGLTGLAETTTNRNA